MTRVHIKFLAHGKGSPAKASAYLLDELDHMGVVRAGVDVLRGDATTFNAVCDASPHLWKYTSGVIAWSKEDDPTNEQIQEILNDFEKHAFAGLDPSQYHFFAVLHTDNDSSKHIHVLAPRLNIQSGKSLNIAPPGHEKHFDSLRDYFNTKYQWSRPDDLLLMQTTQEPNHIAKLNIQAKNILTSQAFETLTKKQFCKTIDNYVQTLLKTQIAENRADIVECIEQVKGVESVKQSKEFLTVTLSNGKKHRLKGDFYNEQFEIGLYSECLRAEAESRPTSNELAQAIRDAKSIRDDYRAKREAYNSKQHAFTGSTANDNSPQIASKFDINRNRQSIPPSPERDDSELQSANRRIVDSASEYRYIGNIKSEIEHKFVLNINSGSTEPHQQPVAEHFDRQTKSTKEHSIPSTASDSGPKRTDRERYTKADHGEIERTEIKIHSLGDDIFCTADSFNRFISGLSSQYKSKDHRSAARSHSTEFTSDYQPNHIFGQLTEIGHADRNRPLFDRAKQLINATKQLVSRTKQGFESTSQFIEEHLDRLQQIRTGASNQNPKFAVGERRPSSLDLRIEGRVIQNRAGQFFTGFTAKLSGQLNEPITNAINTSVKSSKFKQYHQQLSDNITHTDTKDYHHTADRPTESSLESLATRSIANYTRRLAHTEQANYWARINAGRLNIIDSKFKEISDLIKNIRIEPESALDFIDLRYDGYYRGYVYLHKNLTKKQDQAYRSKKTLQLIECVAEKYENLERYMSTASNYINRSAYEHIEKMIKNDEIMLKYLRCESILTPRNDHLESQRQLYKKCLVTFEDIKNIIANQNTPSPQKYFSGHHYEPENQPKPNSDFDVKF